MKVIGLDVGRNKVKAYSHPMLTSFSAFIGDYRPLRLERELDKGDKVVEYDGARYYVGQIAEDESMDGVQNFLVSKVHHDTKVLGLTAIHALVDDGEEILLSTGHPIVNHTVEEKAGLKRLFLGEHEITVNGVRKRVIIRQVIVTAECACATYLLPERHPFAHGIDGGGATTNIATWKKGLWVDKLSHTFPYGRDNTAMSIDRYARMVAIDSTKRIHEFRGPIYTMGGVASELAVALRWYIGNAPIIPLDSGVMTNAKAYYEVGVMVDGRVQNVQTQR